MRILLFGGTAEGRLLGRLLAGNGAEVVLRVATGYGRELVDVTENMDVCSGAMDEGEMILYMKKKPFDCVIDATHPYADTVTGNIQSACDVVGVKYIRLVRESNKGGRLMYTSTAEEAAEILNKTHGNILLTTGSKNLKAFTRIESYAERVYIRILPMIESLEKARSLGFRGRNIICMQGPFSMEMNKAALRWASASYMVTKDSGDTGGFSEKVSAALSVGCKVIVLARPREEAGLSFREVLDYFGIKPPLERQGFFPLFFDLTDRLIMVIGGGKIAQRRVEILRGFGAKILLVSESLTEELERLADREDISYRAGSYREKDLELMPFLVIAATDSRDVNSSIGRAAKNLGIPHIIADCREECDVYFPAIADNPSFIAGIISKDGNHRAVKDMADNIRGMLNG